ncbi:hypothetical protein B0H14DRAFT_2653191 [Mycena olivaceomarginata]|nr:hypothetical protein B0H14DRAFT_2653191 [Mycena olivaceomarginata]
MGNAHHGLVLAGLLTLLIACRRRSAICHISGPPSASWLFGNMQQLMLPLYGRYEFKLAEDLRPSLPLKRMFRGKHAQLAARNIPSLILSQQDRLMISDPVALQYILNSPQFKFGPGMANSVHLLYGKGSIACTNKQAHKRIHAALSGGFTMTAIQNYIPIYKQAAQMISEQFENSPAGPINVSPILSHATLSTISEGVAMAPSSMLALTLIRAALGCSINDLEEKFISNNIEII